MFRFWDLVIATVIEAAEARRVVEVGALRGDNTVQMLERLGADVELHVIDPVPAFDPTEHERRFRGRYVFHRDISHNVLPQLPPVDVALIDGDHNWYTVYHELRMLSATARLRVRRFRCSSCTMCSGRTGAVISTTRLSPFPRSSASPTSSAGWCLTPSSSYRRAG